MPVFVDVWGVGGAEGKLAVVRAGWRRSFGVGGLLD